MAILMKNEGKGSDMSLALPGRGADVQCQLERRAHPSGRRPEQEVSTWDHPQTPVIGTAVVSEVVQQERWSVPDILVTLASLGKL